MQIWHCSCSDEYLSSNIFYVYIDAYIYFYKSKVMLLMLFSSLINIRLYIIPLYWSLSFLTHTHHTHGFKCPLNATYWMD